MMAAMVGRELQFWRTVTDKHTGEHTGKTNPHSNCLGKQEGWNFLSFATSGA